MTAGTEPEDFVVYQPDQQRRLGWGAYRKMARDLWSARYLLWRLVSRDFLLRVRVFFLGFGWAMVQPLIWMAIFLFLRKGQLLFTGSGGAPYALFAFIGLVHWHLLAGMWTRSTTSLIQASGLLGKVKFPREALVLAACAQALVDWLFSLPIVALVFGLHGRWPSRASVLLPVAVVPLVMLGVGGGLLFAVVALPLRDVALAVPAVLTPLMFLTPVLYEFPTSAGWRLLRALNPVACFLDVIRAALLGLPGPSGAEFVWWLAFCLLLLLWSWRFFAVVMPKVAEQT